MMKRNRGIFRRKESGYCTLSIRNSYYTRETVVPFMFEDLGVENAMEGTFLAGDMAVVKKDGQYGCIRVHSYTK